MNAPDGRPPELRGERVLLRAAAERDRKDRLATGRDADAVRMYGGDARNLQPLTEADAHRWHRALDRDPLAW